MMPACHNHDILAAVLGVGHHVGLAAARQDVGPDGFTGFYVDRADQIVGRRGNEQQSSCRHDTAAIVGRTDRERNAKSKTPGTVCACRTEGPVP